MLFLYRFFLGVLEIAVYGIYPEKMLNLCEKHKISVWDIRFQKGKICCKINVKDFKRLPKIFRKQGVRLHILKRWGLPFFTNKYKRRFGIFAGLLIFVFMLNFLSGFVWIIDVRGNKGVSDFEIISDCQKIGVKEGIFVKGFDAKNKAQELLLKNNKLSWASFNIEGCVLTVDVTEITPKDEGEFLASNLVADSDGIIKHIDVTVGNCVVKVGDTVKKGDVLVSGIIENENGTKFVKSRGKIIAETVTVTEVSQNYIIEESVLTGKQKTKTVLEAFTFEIPLYLGVEKGEYESNYTAKNLKLFGNAIPIRLHRKHFIFKETKEVKLSFDLACERLTKQIEKQYPNAEVKKDFFDNYTFVTMKAKIYESRDIATSQNLIFNIEK
ncbi:MAG: hypothetical protein E7545_01905 [Ruminococcaceae bacterium]|nr:hypothetical protein [Oscillospiraceae bacterium]